MYIVYNFNLSQCSAKSVFGCKNASIKERAGRSRGRPRDIIVYNQQATRRMTHPIVITAAHWAYVAGILAIVLTMVLRANVVLPSIVATFVVALAWTASPVGAVASIFNASFV